MKKSLLLFGLLAGFVGFTKAQTLDTNFNVTLGESNYIKQVIPQSDGKILICGQITSVNGVERNGIARLNEDGSLDNSFEPNLPAGTSVNRMLLKMDNNILVSTNPNPFMRQLDSNGKVQTNFVFGDIPGYGYAQYMGGAIDMVQLENGKILILHGEIYIQDYSTNYILAIRKGIFRVNNDGSLDLSFYYYPESAASDTKSMAILSDGKILIGGHYMTFGNNMSLLRLENDGTNDNTFNENNFGPNQPIEALTLINNQYVIAGSFTSYNNHPIKHVALIQEDGSLNTTFQTGDGFNNTLIYKIKNYGIGTVLVGGQFQSFNGVSRNAFLALNPNGTLNSVINSDNIFSSGSAVYDIGIQNDGKIIVVGALSVNSSGGKKVSTGIARFLAPELNTKEIATKKIDVYPNPVKDILHFSEEVSNIKITDSAGRTVKEISAKSKSVNVSNLAKGVYIISAVAKSGETVTKKIVKE